MIDREHFGDFDGQSVHRFTLQNVQGMRAQIMTWGATLTGLRSGPEHAGMRDLVLGFRKFDDYPTHSPYFGATVGRFANRIGGARCNIDGKEIRLDPNQDGIHHIHGGSDGLSKRVWQAEAAQMRCGPSLRLTLTSPDRDQGYPGEFEAECIYELLDDNCLRIVMRASCSEPCPANLVHHSYWNLDGQGVIDQHHLQLFASSYLPTGSGQIPTGEIRPVAGSHFDFSEIRQLDHHGAPIIDNAFIIDGADALRPAAILQSQDGKKQMELWTDQPAVQCYTGFKLNVAGASGEKFGPRSGICLETEAFPDAPNKPQFPSAILRPGQLYTHEMQHRFSFS